MKKYYRETSDCKIFCYSESIALNVGAAVVMGKGKYQCYSLLRWLVLT